MIKLLIIGTIFFISACSTTDKCSQIQIDALKNEHASLLVSKSYIERLESGKPVPGIVFSSLSREELIAAYKRSYNKSFDTFMYHNSRCIR